MEYPKTHEDAIKELQGKWQTKNGEISFEIIGTGIINIEGKKEISGICDLTKTYFTLRPQIKGLDFWILHNPPLFGFEAKIIRWDEMEFTTRDSTVQLLNPNMVSTPMFTETTYVRVI